MQLIIRFYIYISDATISHIIDISDIIITLHAVYCLYIMVQPYLPFLTYVLFNWHYVDLSLLMIYFLDDLTDATSCIYWTVCLFNVKLLASALGWAYKDKDRRRWFYYYYICTIL